LISCQMKPDQFRPSVAATDPTAGAQTLPTRMNAITSA